MITWPAVMYGPPSRGLLVQSGSLVRSTSLPSYTTSWQGPLATNRVGIGLLARRTVSSKTLPWDKPSARATRLIAGQQLADDGNLVAFDVFEKQRRTVGPFIMNLADRPELMLGIDLGFDLLQFMLFF